MADYVMGEQTGGGGKGKHKRRKGDEGLAKAEKGGGKVITTNPNAKKLFRILFRKKFNPPKF